MGNTLPFSDVSYPITMTTLDRYPETCVRVVLHLSRSAKPAIGFFAMTQAPGFTRASFFMAKQKYRFLDCTPPAVMNDDSEITLTQAFFES